MKKGMQEFFERTERFEKRVAGNRRARRRLIFEKALIAIRTAIELIQHRDAVEASRKSGRKFKEELAHLQRAHEDLRTRSDSRKPLPPLRRSPAQETRRIEESLLAKFGDMERVLAGFSEIIRTEYELPKSEKVVNLTDVSIHLELCSYYYELVMDRDEFPKCTALVDAALMSLLGFANIYQLAGEQRIHHMERTSKATQNKNVLRIKKGWGPVIIEMNSRIDQEVKAGKRPPHDLPKEIERRLVREFADETKFPPGEKDYPSARVIQTTLNLPHLDAARRSLRKEAEVMKT